MTKCVLHCFALYVFCIAMCSAIFQELEISGEQREEQTTLSDDSNLRNAPEDNFFAKKEERQKNHERLGLKKRSRPPNARYVPNSSNKFSKKKRNSEGPSPGPVYYMIKNPGHVGEGSKLRIEFIHPGSNNESSPNFWPEVPNPAGKNGGEDLTSEFKAGISDFFETTTPTLTATEKKPGFFEGIGEFFKHSFHMDKTTAPIESTTGRILGKTPDAATLNSTLQPGPLSHLDHVARQWHEDPAREGAPLLPKNNKPSRGRDATFNLRIKAIPVRRLQGVLGAGGGPKLLRI